MNEVVKPDYLTRFVKAHLIDTPIQHPIPKRLELIDYLSLTMITLFVLGIINNIASR